MQLQNPAALARMKAGFGTAIGKPVGDLEFFAWSGGKSALRDQISARLKAAGYVLTPLHNLTAPGIQAYTVSRGGHAVYEVWSRDTMLADVTFFQVGSDNSTLPAAPPAPAPSSRVWAAKGYAALNARKYQAATDAYQKALAADPHNAEYLYNLGVALDGLKHYSAAAASYRTAISLKPNTRDARTNLGIDLVILKKYPEAIKILREATVRQPNDALAFHSLGDAYYNSGQNNLAAAAYSRATKLAPDDPASFLYLGDALGNLGKTAEAMAAYAQAARLDPGLRAVAARSEAALQKKEKKPSVAAAANPSPGVVLPVPDTPAPPVPPTDAVVGADTGPPPPGDYRCTWSHRDPNAARPTSEYMGRFTLKSDGTYTWMDSTEVGTYTYDPATEEITFTGGRLGREGVKARFHHTRAGAPMIFISFNTDYTRAKGKGAVLWECVPENSGTISPQ